MHNALFIYAHMDDETILSYGTIKSFIEKNYNVTLVTVCGYGRKDSDNLKRLTTYQNIIKELDIKNIILPYYDLNIDEIKCKNRLQQIIFDIKPDIVITHSCNDLHFEHRLLGEMSLVLCRNINDCTVKTLLHTQSNSGKLTFNKFGVYRPNYYIDISKYTDEKLKYLSKYTTELPIDRKDFRNPEYIIFNNKDDGILFGVDAVESYEQIFRLEQW